MHILCLVWVGKKKGHTIFLKRDGGLVFRILGSSLASVLLSSCQDGVTSPPPKMVFISPWLLSILYLVPLPSSSPCGSTFKFTNRNPKIILPRTSHPEISDYHDPPSIPYIPFTLLFTLSNTPIPQNRWVATANNKIWTSSGVSAGTDCFLAFLEHVYGVDESSGQTYADLVSRNIEYQRVKGSEDDPFAEENGCVDVPPVA